MAAIGTRKLTLMIDGDEVAPEVSTAQIKSGDAGSDFVSFADAATGGGRQYTLALTFVQDAAAGSLWDRVWSAAGTDIDVTVRPYGNAVATAAEPHFTGTVTVSEPENMLGGDADPSNSARFTSDVEWVFLTKPTRVIA